MQSAARLYAQSIPKNQSKDVISHASPKAVPKQRIAETKNEPESAQTWEWFFVSQGGISKKCLEEKIKKSSTHYGFAESQFCHIEFDKTGVVTVYYKVGETSEDQSQQPNDDAHQKRELEAKADALMSKAMTGNDMRIINQLAEITHKINDITKRMQSMETDYGHKKEKDPENKPQMMTKKFKNGLVWVSEAPHYVIHMETEQFF